MNVFITSVINVVLLLPITCIQTYLYSKTIGLNPKYKGLRLALIVLCITIVEAALQPIAALFVMGPIVIATLIIAIYFLYPVVFMGGKIKERVLFGVINFAIFMFASLFLSLGIYPDVAIDLEVSWQTMPLYLVIAISVYTVYLVLVLIIVRLNMEGRQYIPRQYWIGIVICFSVIVVGFIGVLNLINWFADVEMSRMYALIISLVYLFIWLLIYFIFSFICRYFAKVNEANALVIQNDMIERYMLRKQASDERIQILSHDLRYSLTQWRVLAEEKGDADILQSISEYEQQLISSLLINVENENANAIINQKQWEAGHAQVEFLVDGVFHEDLLIARLDLCSLLGNLLDNAIEAAVQVQPESSRCVKLSIRRKGNLLILIVENSYAVEPVLENGIFVTTKEDKDFHTIGMRSIRYIAEKYNGVVNNSYENNWFKATVMLSGYKNVLSDEK